jgi:hypothetical protein
MHAFPKPVFQGFITVTDYAFYSLFDLAALQLITNSQTISC